jgi:hypothetical protein
MKYLLILLTILVFSCDKNAHGYNELSDLLQSQTWYISYIQEISESGQVRFDQSYPYDIYKLDFNQKNIIIKTSRDIFIGEWVIIDGKNLILKIDTPDNIEINKLSGEWVVDDVYVWGYDQDRIVLKKNNIEIGLN